MMALGRLHQFIGKTDCYRKLGRNFLINKIDLALVKPQGR
jgi:hypothetical protein